MFFDKIRWFQYITKRCVKSAAIMGLIIAPMFSGFSYRNPDMRKTRRHNTARIKTQLESSKIIQKVSDLSKNTDLSQPRNDSSQLQVNPETQNPRLTEIMGEYLKKDWKGMVFGTISGQVIDYAQSQLSTAGTNLAKNYVDLDSISKNINSAANVTTEHIKNYISYASSSGGATTR